jgi:glycine/D-amino acid oxidase-like deaminating enzyme
MSADISVWSGTETPPARKKLSGDINCDVLVIGGGMAGVLCAHELQKNGADTVLAEGRRLGSGATGNTTAVITAQHDTRYLTLVKKFGAEKAAGYLQANLQAVEAFHRLSKEIMFDFEERPSVVFTTSDTQGLRRELDTVRSLGFNRAEWVDGGAAPALPLDIKGGVQFPGMGQMHPLKLLYGLAGRLERVYENTFVTKINKTTAFTDGGCIKAKNIIIATHFPFINRAGLYFMKLYQARSYVLALEDAAQIDATCVDDESGLYFRNYQNLLLVGGGDARTGRTRGYCDVRRFAEKNYPNSPVRYQFAAQDCMSLDGVPYIGAYSPLMPGVYAVSGFGEWGMTSSMVAARLLADELCGKANEFSKVFSTRRSILRKQFWANLGETLINFAKPTAKRCTHMGCSLTRNKEEGTWDCRCHGSRFDGGGALIDNPAMKDRSK